jgi:hypothetical protein
LTKKPPWIGWRRHVDCVLDSADAWHEADRVNDQLALVVRVDAAANGHRTLLDVERQFVGDANPPLAQPVENPLAQVPIDRNRVGNFPGGEPIVALGTGLLVVIV